MLIKAIKISNLFNRNSNSNEKSTPISSIRLSKFGLDDYESKDESVNKDGMLDSSYSVISNSKMHKSGVAGRDFRYLINKYGEIYRYNRAL